MQGIAYNVFASSRANGHCSLEVSGVGQGYCCGEEAVRPVGRRTALGVLRALKGLKGLEGK